VPRQRLGQALRRGLRLSIQAGVAGKVSGLALVNGRAARKLGLSRGSVAVVGSGSTYLPSTGTTTLVVRFTSKVKRKLRRAERLPLTVHVAVTPAAGPRATASKAFNLRR
jgi:hypothetical protein